MNRQWYGRDRGLTTRMGLTMFGLGLLYVGFMTVVIALGAGAVAVTFFAGVVLLVQLLISDRLALAGMRARVVSPDEAPELHAIVERLCQLADLPKPRLAIADTAVPNAFAAGRGRSASTVCVTTGLLERLDAEQLQGVLAHELSHIANRDVAVMTVASFMATVAGLLIRMGTYGRVGGKGNAAVAFLVLLAASVAVYAVSYLLLRALSRYREFAADRGAAIMTGAPSQLASALVAISEGVGRSPDRDLRATEPMNAFFIIPTRPGGLSLSRLFSTHPPVEDRIERLMRMQAQIDARPV